MGTFVYALNVGGWPGGMVMGDANFTADDVDGVEIVAQHRLFNWGDLDLGPSVRDDGLETVVRTVRWTEAPTPLVVTLGDLTPLATYKAQLLFGSPVQRPQDTYQTRGFDVRLLPVAHTYSAHTARTSRRPSTLAAPRRFSWLCGRLLSATSRPRSLAGCAARASAAAGARCM